MQTSFHKMKLYPRDTHARNHEDDYIKKLHVIFDKNEVFDEEKERIEEERLEEIKRLTQELSSEDEHEEGQAPRKKKWRTITEPKKGRSLYVLRVQGLPIDATEKRLYHLLCKYAHPPTDVKIIRNKIFYNQCLGYALVRYHHAKDAFAVIDRAEGAQYDEYHPIIAKLEATTGHADKGRLKAESSDSEEEAEEVKRNKEKLEAMRAKRKAEREKRTARRVEKESEAALLGTYNFNFQKNFKSSAVIAQGHLKTFATDAMAVGKLSHTDAPKGPQTLEEMKQMLEELTEQERSDELLAEVKGQQSEKIAFVEAQLAKMERDAKRAELQGAQLLLSPTERSAIRIQKRFRGRKTRKELLYTTSPEFLADQMERAKRKLAVAKKEQDHIKMEEAQARIYIVGLPDKEIRKHNMGTAWMKERQREDKEKLNVYWKKKAKELKKERKFLEKDLRGDQAVERQAKEKNYRDKDNRFRGASKEEIEKWIREKEEGRRHLEVKHQQQWNLLEADLKILDDEHEMEQKSHFQRMAQLQRMALLDHDKEICREHGLTEGLTHPISHIFTEPPPPEPTWVDNVLNPIGQAADWISPRMGNSLRSAEKSAAHEVHKVLDDETSSDEDDTPTIGGVEHGSRARKKKVATQKQHGRWPSFLDPVHSGVESLFGFERAKAMEENEAKVW